MQYAWDLSHEVFHSFPSRESERWLEKQNAPEIWPCSRECYWLAKEFRLSQSALKCEPRSPCVSWVHAATAYALSENRWLRSSTLCDRKYKLDQCLNSMWTYDPQLLTYYAELACTENVLRCCMLKPNRCVLVNCRSSLSNELPCFLCAEHAPLPHRNILCINSLLVLQSYLNLIEHIPSVILFALPESRGHWCHCSDTYIDTSLGPTTSKKPHIWPGIMPEGCWSAIPYHHSVKNLGLVSVFQQFMPYPWT